MNIPAIFDVTLRDGLMVRNPAPTVVKTEVLRRLLKCGINHAEVVRFPVDGQHAQFNDTTALLNELPV